MEWNNKKVLVFGAGKSGIGSCKLLDNVKAQTILYDGNANLDEEKILKQLPEDTKVKIVKGAFPEEMIPELDLMVMSPGVPTDLPVVLKVKEAGVPVWGEIELAYVCGKGEILGITGTNGKTTTTSLLGEIAKNAFESAFVVGNIGNPYTTEAGKMREDSVIVAELSSFQLISMRTSPDVAVITNIAPNHLDVHGTMEEYIDSKKNLILHQNAFSKTVLNLDNELTNNLSDIVRGKLVKFSRRNTVECGAFLNENGILCYNDYGKITEVVKAEDIRIPGIHNVENYLTAISAVWGEVSIDVIQTVAKEFGGVEHRIEFVRELDGVKYYNDSIATSPTRVLAGLNSFNQKLIVIAGGYDKKIPFEPMAETVCNKVKHLILMGITAESNNRMQRIQQR